MSGPIPPDDADLEDEASPAESLADRLRDMPVGTNDPNIVGDAGPLDVPPGTDGDVPAEIDPAEESAADQA